MPAKAGIQVCQFPGFRVALAIACFPGMTDEVLSNVLGRYASFTIAPDRGDSTRGPAYLRANIAQVPRSPKQFATVFHLRCADRCRYSPEKFRRES
jgi:hypothetical protein